MTDFSFIRPIIEKFYEGRCTVTETRLVKDPVTKLTRPKKEVTILEDYPCRLSNTSEPISENSPLPRANHAIKLFISPDVTINPGSHITVTQHGITAEYSSSGDPAVYCTHQEINLEKWDKAL